ncbi:MAG: hypothetical protein COA78_10940 [Blastopirellula sp.]|nr:MAG: hypothetical protein COA78_10940 [Blastopirellula sp.]
MASKKKRSIFWIVSTHVLTTGFVIPGAAGVIASQATSAMQYPPVATFLIILAAQAVGYIGGVFYSFSYIRKVAIIQNPAACITPAIVTFIVLAIIGLGLNLYIQIGGKGNDINPVVTAIALVIYYVIISILFARFTRNGFLQMAVATQSE